jgi:hypothetical protein
MIENYYTHNLEMQSSQSEKLFQILEKLQSIIDNIEVRKDAEQFIYGVQASMAIVRAEINGKSNPFQESIYYPE